MQFDQQQIIEDVKKLLQDLDHFFTITLKKEKLKKDTIAEKDKLNGQIKETLVKLVGEEPQEEYDDVGSFPQQGEEDGADSGMLYDETVVEAQKPHRPLDTISHTGSQRSLENEDDEDKGDINYDGTKIRPKSVSELGQTNKEGNLEKKRKEGQFGFSAWQNRFCIIKDNMMYYYKSKSDGKQCNEIDLSGYEATSAPDVEKKHKRKHLLFIVSKPGARSFQFIAPDEKELKSWMDAINFASQLTPPPPEKVPNSGGDTVSMVSEKEEDFGEEYEDLSDYQKTPMGQQAIPAFDEHAQDEGDDFGDEYEDLDEYQKMKIGKMKVEPQISQDFGETYDDVSVTQTTVDSHISVRDTPLPPPPEELPPRPPPIHSTPLPPPPTMDAPKPPSRDLPSIPPRETPPRDLPPPPADIVSSNALGEKEPWEDDYKNIYMGKWDCRADENNELDFKRGDLIHILSQEYDGWWIGEKNYRVGLVPKDFLMKAYI